MERTPEQSGSYALRCADIWSGNHSASNDVTTPGLELLVHSEPYQGEARGGDVHYVALCAGGVVTRIVLADVSGHGHVVAETSHALRSLVRRFMNSNSQTRLVREINREFSNLTQSRRFATAIIATHLANDGRLTLCNAGHPRPLWFRHSQQRWQFVNQDLVGDGRISNLPLGFDADMTYQQFRISLEVGDIFVFYTDALTEAEGVDGSLLGEEGLLNLISPLPTENIRDLKAGLLDGLRQFTNHRPAGDDLTILVLRYTGTRWRMPGIGEQLNAFAKLLGLKKI